MAFVRHRKGTLAWAVEDQVGRDAESVGNRGIEIRNRDRFLLLGNCFWRKGFEAAFGPDRMGEKGG